MPKGIKDTAKRTRLNPFGLTYKQQLVVADVTAKVGGGKRADILGSVEKFYNVKNRNTAKSVLVNLNKNVNFRDALISSLIEKRIVGSDSVTEDVLVSGLYAETPKGDPDYDIRLRHVQEINKIVGVYAPEKRQSLNLNVDMTEEELDNHIKDLQEQLK